MSPNMVVINCLTHRYLLRKHDLGGSGLFAFVGLVPDHFPHRVTVLTHFDESLWFGHYLVGRATKRWSNVDTDVVEIGTMIRTHTPDCIESNFIR